MYILKSYNANNSAAWNPYASNKLCTQCRPQLVYIFHLCTVERISEKKSQTSTKKQLEEAKGFRQNYVGRE